MSWKPIAAIATVLAGSAILLHNHHNHLDGLRQENQSLKARLQESQKLSSEMALKLQAVKPEQTNNAVLAELLRLRGEVGRLRQAEGEVAKLQARLQAEVKPKRFSADPPAEDLQSYEYLKVLNVAALKEVGMQFRLLHRDKSSINTFPRMVKLTFRMEV